MGYGDKLMAIGDAWKQHRLDPRRRAVAIGDGTSIDLTDIDLAEGLDFLASPDLLASGADVSWIYSYRGNRPYIDYEAMVQAQRREKPWLRWWPFKRYDKGSALGRYIFNPDYRATPAPVQLRPEELRIAEEWSQRPIALIEPFVKPEAPPSKQWPVDRFAEVARRLSSDIAVYQIGGTSSPALPGLPQIRPRSFRESLAYLRAARLFVGPEGGPHHAAAAVGTKAVVVFGGFISPQTTGYDFHINLTGGATYACGTQNKMCPHCLAALNNISVDEVLNHAHALLAQPPNPPP